MYKDPVLLRVRFHLLSFKFCNLLSLVFIKPKILASYRLLVLFMTGILYWRCINWFFFHELVIWKCWFHLICLKSRATLTMLYFLTLKLDYTNWTISRNTLNSSPVFTLHCLITLQDCASFGFSCELVAVVTLPNFIFNYTLPLYWFLC